MNSFNHNAAWTWNASSPMMLDSLNWLKNLQFQHLRLNEHSLSEHKNRLWPRINHCSATNIGSNIHIRRHHNDTRLWAEPWRAMAWGLLTPASRAPFSRQSYRETEGPTSMVSIFWIGNRESQPSSPIRSLANHAFGSATLKLPNQKANHLSYCRNGFLWVQEVSVFPSLLYDCA